MPAAPYRTYNNAMLQPAAYPELARTLPVALKPAGAGLTVELVRGTVLGIITATGKFTAYSDAGVAGEAVARAILAYDVSVDDAGNVTLTEVAGGAADHGEKLAAVPAYFKGLFSSAELTGLDAAGAADLGRFWTGDSTTGLLSVE